MDLIDKYFKSWREQTLDIVNIFDINAIYKVKPFCEEEYYGLDNIVKYWKLNPMTQKNPQPEIIECFSNDIKDKIFCEFTNNYIIDNKTKTTHGMILFKIKNGKIYELNEFYKSKYL